MPRAVKKSELYQSLWDSCDQLRGSMDASQYKDYVLTLLFVKYVSDKATGNPYEEIQVPEGGSFNDMVALKNKSNIGEGMDKIVAKLAEANNLQGVITNAHFNDEAKLGKGKEMVDTLTGLIGIFQRPELDFSKNTATDDDLIGDAYEYLMRKFATESGKSKGQFYTPAEVARVLAKVIQVGDCANRQATVYDPACGSGSLLIRVLAEAPVELAGYGQEKDNTTAGLAKMNAVLHGKPTVDIYTGNTFADPHNFETGGHDTLQRFDYVVANPPFSMKNWQNGLEACLDRFEGYGDQPPKKNADYAWLLHILASLKSTGKAAVILPHGVLFRGNAEGTIRESIIKRGWIKGIIGLPANLFYGTGIPACIVVIDKEHADARKSIFMVDASREFVKDGNKNRLRECDVFRIVETFVNELEDDPTYSRMVPISEIAESNGYNLNLSRYLESAIVEDVQDIDAHLNGGIPNVDLDALDSYWRAFPTLRESLFEPLRPGYSHLKVERPSLREAIIDHGDCQKYWTGVEDAFSAWMNIARSKLLELHAGTDSAVLLESLYCSLLDTFADHALLGRYDVYQALLSYWDDVMADDVLLIAQEGWDVAKQVDIVYKTRKKTVNGEKVDVSTGEIKSYEGLVIPGALIEKKFFPEESHACTLCAAAQAKAESDLESLQNGAKEGSILFDLVASEGVSPTTVNAQISELLDGADNETIRVLTKFQEWFETEKRKKKDYVAYIGLHQECSAVINEKGNVTKTSIADAISSAKEAQGPDEDYLDDYNDLLEAKRLLAEIAEAKAQYKVLRNTVDARVCIRYETLTSEELVDLIINEKWFHGVFDGIEESYESLVLQLVDRIDKLTERYQVTLPRLQADFELHERTVLNHLAEMGFAW